MFISSLILPLTGHLDFTSLFKLLLFMLLGLAFPTIALGVFFFIKNIIIKLYYRIIYLNPKLITHISIFYIILTLFIYIYLNSNSIFLDTHVNVDVKGINVDVKGSFINELAIRDELLAFTVGATIGAFAVKGGLLPKVGGASFSGAATQLTYLLTKDTGEMFRGSLKVLYLNDKKVEVDAGHIVPVSNTGATVSSTTNSGNFNIRVYFFPDLRNFHSKSVIEESFIRRVTIEHNSQPQPNDNTTTVLKLVEKSDISSKFKDPSNLIPNYSIEEYKQITDSIVASSPYEDAVRTHVGNVLHLLELHLTLSLCMICIVLFIIYVFTIKLFFEKHVNVNSNSNSTSNFTSTYISNFILKLPFGKTLQYFVNKMVVVFKYSGNIWFYYMFFCLLIATIGSSYCIYICILILKMIPS